jgi:two-component system catabolic regulation response regulator CreB
MQRQKILLVEDEQAIADTLLYALGSEGFEVVQVAFGSEAIAALRHSVDLIILDVGLPDTTGFEVLKRVRAQPESRDVPVIFLTARAEEIDRILGLELGADDYVTKPFSPREVAARVRAILRREARSRGTDTASTQTGLPSLWQHDPAGMLIALGGRSLDLTRYEYQLLALLLSSPGRVFTREQIMDRIWSSATETSDRSIDTHIKTLRAKLRIVDPVGEHIVTHRGIGYSLAP